jgi:hypothetical protein
MEKAKLSIALEKEIKGAKWGTPRKCLEKINS